MFTEGFVKVAKDKKKKGLTDAQKAGLMGLGLGPVGSGIYTGTKAKKDPVKSGVKAGARTYLGQVAGGIGGGLATAGLAAAALKAKHRGVPLKVIAKRHPGVGLALGTGSLAGSMYGAYKGAKGAHEDYAKKD